MNRSIRSNNLGASAVGVWLGMGVVSLLLGCNESPSRAVAPEAVAADVGGTTTITSQPKNQIVSEGEGFKFSVTATGTGTLHYQWMKRNHTHTFLGTIPGATGTTYSVAASTAADSNFNYFCSVSDGTQAGTVSSAEASLKLIVVNDFEAENGTFAGGASVKSNWTGYTGTGFVSFPSTAGSSANWTVYRSGGTYTFTFRYATAVQTESIRLYVNGGLAVNNVPLPGNSPTTWKTVTVNVPLVSRKNVITAYTTGTGGLVIDNFHVN